MVSLNPDLMRNNPMERKQSDSGGSREDPREIEKKSPRPDLDVQGRPSKEGGTSAPGRSKEDESRRSSEREGSGGRHPSTISDRGEGRPTAPGRSDIERE
ncbi:MAG TPA: hypothetical protein VMS76_10745 [Planctomycetota bacterium]|nr:hypothetical protein [Planctomycetota bacterium]